DPPNNTLPSEDEIAKLPRWAQVAFAARCARRVLPLLQRFWSEIPADDFRTVAGSVKNAETVAATTRRDDAITNVFKLGVVDAAHHVSAKAYSIGGEAAAAVALCAAKAIYAAYKDESDLLTSEVADAAVRAQFPPTQLKPPISVTPPIRRDFDHLVV